MLTKPMTETTAKSNPDPRAQLIEPASLRIGTPARKDD
jgi:hypothetical protein